jgi:hypothetical protein
MLTSNPNRKPNHHNPLFFRTLRLFRPLVVRFAAFFSNNAPAPLFPPPSEKKSVEKALRPFSRIYRNNPHQRLYISPNTLRLIVMWWLAFLVSYLAALQIILTTGTKA